MTSILVEETTGPEQQQASKHKQHGFPLSPQLPALKHLQS
jgi:hypothetical protein